MHTLPVAYTCLCVYMRDRERERNGEWSGRDDEKGRRARGQSRRTHRHPVPSRRRSTMGEPSRWNIRRLANGPQPTVSHWQAARGLQARIGLAARAGHLQLVGGAISYKRPSHNPLPVRHRLAAETFGVSRCSVSLHLRASCEFRSVQIVRPSIDDIRTDVWEESVLVLYFLPRGV